MKIATIDLSISPTYVPDWTYFDAVRELLQNAKDQQTLNADNQMQVVYDEELEVLSIESKLSSLARNTLLLGSSSKQDDSATIGKFGEGYKLAIMVLSRDGHEVQIFNHANKERWVPSIKYAKTFQQEVLSVAIHKYLFTTPPSNNLSFSVANITLEHFEEICKHTLDLRDYPEHIETKYGNILTTEAEAGKLYINGLYVETVEDCTYGYDIKPEHLPLDRDRKTIRTFELYWLTSRLWATTDRERALELLVKGAQEVQYIDSMADNSTLADYTYKAFVKAHGSDAVPVTDQDERDRLLKTNPKIKAISVPTSYASMYRRSCYYSTPTPEPVIEKKSPVDVIVAMLDSLGIDPEDEKCADCLEAAAEWEWTDD